MRTYLFYFLTLTSSIGFAQVNSETRKVGSFESIKVGNSIDVRLTQGDKESVLVTAEGVALNEVITNISGGVLKIGLDQFKFRTKVKVTVKVTYVRLHRIEVSTAASVLADKPIKTESLELEANTASSIEIAIDADKVIIEAATASDVILSGNVRQLNVVTETSSNVDASQLKTNKATAKANTASGIRLFVTEDLTAEAKTAATIRYRGNPARSNTSSTTAGTIKHVD